MKLTVTKPVEMNVTAVRARFPIRHPEDFTGGDDFPGRNGETITMDIDIDTGVVKDWPAGRTAELYEKVCDEGDYHLIDGDEVIASRTDNYVPGFFPADHFGDYIIFNIDGTGKIEGWKAVPARVAEAFDD